MNFKIQLFGDDDTITSGNTLYIGFETSANKTEYINIANPTSDLTEESVKEFASYVLDNNVFLDKNESGSYTSVLTAYTEEKTNIKFDLA